MARWVVKRDFRKILIACHGDSGRPYLVLRSCYTIPCPFGPAMEIDDERFSAVLPDVGWAALGLDLLAGRRILEREPYNHSSFSGLSPFPDGFHALPSFPARPPFPTMINLGWSLALSRRVF